MALKQGTRSPPSCHPSSCIHATFLCLAVVRVQPSAPWDSLGLTFLVLPSCLLKFLLSILLLLGVIWTVKGIKLPIGIYLGEKRHNQKWFFKASSSFFGTFHSTQDFSVNSLKSIYFKIIGKQLWKNLSKQFLIRLILGFLLVFIIINILRFFTWT